MRSSSSVEERFAQPPQTVSRFLGPEGLLVGITRTPSLRDEKQVAEEGR